MLWAEADLVLAQPLIGVSVAGFAPRLTGDRLQAPGGKGVGGHAATTVMMVLRAQCLSRPSLENAMYGWAWRGEHAAGPARGAVIYQDPGRAHGPGRRRTAWVLRRR